MDKTIVYVFGPKRLHDDYLKNNPVQWVKIGQTDVVKEDEEKKKDMETIALDRIKGEAKTGIPETCYLYDAFVFPKKGKVDNDIRRKLTETLYQELETSYENNKFVGKDDQREIKAGREFVYGVTRKMIRNAVESYSYELLQNTMSFIFSEDSKFEDASQLKNLYNLLQENSKDDEDESSEKDTANDEFYKNLWEKVAARLSNLALSPSDRSYAIIKSKHSACQYVLKYKKNKCQLSVSLESFAKDFSKSLSEINDDEGLKDIIQDKIDMNHPNILSSISPYAGMKRKDKWVWEIVESTATDPNAWVEWYVNTLTELRNFIESFESFV